MSPLSEEHGGIALYLVLGASVLLLLLAATVSSQARQEMRMATAETDAAEIQAMVLGAFEEAAVLAEQDEYWPYPRPDGTGGELSDGTSECTPTEPYSGAPFWYCRDVLPERLVFAFDSEGDETLQYPIRVIWHPSDDPSTRHKVYGWILASVWDIHPDTGKPLVLGVQLYKSWCRPNPDYPASTLLGPCLQGS